MDQPLDLEAFDAAPSGGRVWRVAHLSDIHIVGERYGFRIESGRGGPRGNERVRRVMARLEAEHAARPLDLMLITGDMTDAGRSAEWAEFFDIVAGHPELADRMLVLPGNHDVNVVDRANPARLDLPFSPAKTLRKMRALSAIAAFGADRLRVMQRGRRRARPHACGGACAAARGDRDLRRSRRPSAVEPARAPLGRALSADPSASRGRRPRRRHPQFERRHEFLVHQCARHDSGRPGAQAHGGASIIIPRRDGSSRCTII